MPYGNKEYTRSYISRENFVDLLAPLQLEKLNTMNKNIARKLQVFTKTMYQPSVNLLLHFFCEIL